MGPGSERGEENPSHDPWDRSHSFKGNQHLSLPRPSTGMVSFSRAQTSRSPPQTLVSALRLVHGVWVRCPQEFLLLFAGV